jgi:hypothetical protein
MPEKRGNKEIKVNINSYIKANAAKGHSLDSIKKWLIMHGYDMDFASKSIKNFQRRQIAKSVSLSVFMVSIVLLFVTMPVLNQNITGAVVADKEINEKGCCIDREGLCHGEFPRKYCNYEGVMYVPHSCFDLSYCNVDP